MLPALSPFVPPAWETALYACLTGCFLLVYWVSILLHLSQNTRIPPSVIQLDPLDAIQWAPSHVCHAIPCAAAVNPPPKKIRTGSSP